MQKKSEVIHEGYIQGLRDGLEIINMMTESLEKGQPLDESSEWMDRLGKLFRHGASTERQNAREKARGKKKATAEARDENIKDAELAMTQYTKKKFNSPDYEKFIEENGLEDKTLEQLEQGIETYREGASRQADNHAKIDVEAEVDKVEAAQKKASEKAKNDAIEKKKAEKANHGLELVASYAKKIMQKTGLTPETLKNHFDSLVKGEAALEQTKAAYTAKAGSGDTAKTAN